jgi:hypothetical protein
MKFWNQLRRALSLLRIFRRQTLPVRPLALLPNRPFIPCPLPLEKTVYENGMTIDMFSREPGGDFLFRIYGDAFGRGVARDAEWAHLVKAASGSALETFERIFPSSPPERMDAEERHFILHSRTACKLSESALPQRTGTRLSRADRIRLRSGRLAR